MSTTPTTLTSPPRATPRAWAGLAVLALPTLLVSIDVSVILLALPRASEQLHVDGVQQLWIMDIYSFMIAGFLITMGGVGDRIGRRRLLMIGAAVFGAASVLAAFSVSAEMLIVARALMGIAGATMAPSTLALISNLFADPRQRSVAISIWMACFMAGVAMGPLVGGVLLEHFWWGSVFLLGAPMMVILLVAAPIVLPEFRGGRSGPLDLPSVALSLGTMLPIIYGLKELAHDGARSTPLVVLAVGLVLGFLFLQRQRRLDDPLLNLQLFRNRAFTAALLSMMVTTMMTGPLMIFNAQFFQLIAGLSPLRAGLLMLPAVLTQTAGTLLAPHLAARWRPAYVIGCGIPVTIIGLLIMAQVSPLTGPWPLVVGFAVSCLGTSPLVTLGTDLVVGSVDPDEAGAAGSLFQASGELGFALGIAFLGSIGTVVYRSRLSGSLPVGLPAEVQRAASDSLAGAMAAAHGLPDAPARLIKTLAQDAYSGSIRVVTLIGAVVMLAVGILVVTRLRHLPPTRVNESGVAGRE